MAAQLRLRRREGERQQNKATQNRSTRNVMTSTRTVKRTRL